MAVLDKKRETQILCTGSYRSYHGGCSASFRAVTETVHKAQMDIWHLTHMKDKRYKLSNIQQQN